MKVIILFVILANFPIYILLYRKLKDFILYKRVKKWISINLPNEYYYLFSCKYYYDPFGFGNPPSEINFFGRKSYYVEGKYRMDTLDGKIIFRNNNLYLDENTISKVGKNFFRDKKLNDLLK